MSTRMRSQVVIVGAGAAVWRGDPESERFSVFYLKGGVIEAVLSVNDGRTGRHSRELIRRRLRVDPGVLSDVNSDLRELARAIT